MQLGFLPLICRKQSDGTNHRRQLILTHPGNTGVSQPQNTVLNCQLSAIPLRVGQIYDVWYKNGFYAVFLKMLCQKGADLNGNICMGSIIRDQAGCLFHMAFFYIWRKALRRVPLTVEGAVKNSSSFAVCINLLGFFHQSSTEKCNIHPPLLRKGVDNIIAPTIIIQINK